MKCECGQCWFDGRVWAWRGVGTQKKICIANSTLPGHCPGSCGCRLSVEAGEPRVGLSTRQVLYELMSAISEQLECARWYQGVEHYLWACVQNLKNTQITDAERLALQQLSAMAGGWWAWDYDNPEPTFLPMAEWLALYSTGGETDE